MRIGLFTDTYPPFINGVSTSVLMLKSGLEKLGHEVFVVTVNSESFSYKEEKNILMIPGIPIGIFDYRLTGIYPMKARKIIKKWNLDVIHSHTEFGIGTFARLISKQYNIPLVHTYHTMYEEYIYYITKGYFDGTSKKLVEYLTLFLCDKTIDELIVPTKKAYELFKNKYNVKRNVHIIPTGIAVEKFYKENTPKKEVEALKKELDIKKDDFVILTVGRIAKEKNIEFLINAHKKLFKKCKKAKLVIVGDGPGLKDLYELVHKHKLEKSVIFTGKVPWDVISKYYLISDVFTTASKSETQGLTVIEAMAACKCVATIKDESFENVIKNNEDGFFFETEDEYINLMIKLQKDSALREKIGVNALKKANEYSAMSYAKKVLEIYNMVINKDTNVVKKIIHRAEKVFNKSGGKNE